MNNRYLSIFLIICFIASVGSFLTGCSVKKATKIVIRHESKYKPIAQKVKHENIIDLSDGQKNNYNYNIDPTIKSQNLNFDIKTINSPIQ